MVAKLGKLQEVTVTPNSKGMPLSLVYKGQRRKIASVHEHWRIADGWWGDEVRRDYFRIETSHGPVFDIYRDRISDRWYLTKGGR
jgi:hypothetical protein